MGHHHRLEVAEAQKGAALHAYEEYERKLEHTLKRLDEKGLKKSSLKDLFASQPEYWQTHLSEKSAKLFESLQLLVALNVFSNSTHNLTIHSSTDTEWLDAIELGIILKRPELLDDKKLTSYAPFLDELFPYIWLSFVTVMFINEIHVRYEIWEENTELLTENKKLSRKLASAQKQSGAKIETLKKTVSDTKEALHTSLSENATLKTTLEREKLSREKEKAALLAEIDALRNAVNIPTTSPALAETTEKADIHSCDTEVVSEQEPETSELEIELPDTGVVFIGGHQQFVAKLEILYPQWRILTVGRNDSIPNGYNADVVFAMPKHISHSFFLKCVKGLRDDVPIIHVSSTNIEKLLVEMKTKLAEQQANNS
jgi:hypothetical protein